MKIGKVSGTPEEIKSFLANDGFNARDILDLPKKYEIKWLIFPISLFIVLSFILWIINTPPRGLFGLLVIFEILTIGRVTIHIHLLFKNTLVTILCLLLLVLVFGFCVKLTDLGEALRIIREKIKIPRYD